jgi:hypothetical protein
MWNHHGADGQSLHAHVGMMLVLHGAKPILKQCNEGKVLGAAEAEAG